jgi:23S rRNA pseudouridine2605 synthase
MRMRLQKFLSEAGATSRRAGEKLIEAGRVTVNGRVVTELGTKVDSLHDTVTLDGALVKVRRKHYIALHKPAGYVCSRRDPHGRRTVVQLLPREWSHLPTVGRLDYATEGLIFLSNDGEFALRLTHPRFGIRKRYVVTIEGRIGPEVLARALDGLLHQGELLKAQSGRIIRTSQAQSVVELDLAEGKNREVRRLFEAQALTVIHLKRTQIGPIKLGELPSGRWRALTGVEIKSLLGRASGR